MFPATQKAENCMSLGVEATASYGCTVALQTGDRVSHHLLKTKKKGSVLFHFEHS